MDDSDSTVFTLPISLLANIGPIVSKNDAVQATSNAPKSKAVEATEEVVVVKTTTPDAPKSEPIEATQDVAVEAPTTPDDAIDEAVATPSEDQIASENDDTIVVTGRATEDVSHSVDMDGDSIIITSSVADTHASAYTAKQLRDKLKANQLPTAGGKAAMIQRLLEHDIAL